MIKYECGYINKCTPMSYLVFVAGFGAAAVWFLWLRDARIYARTGRPGYRKAAYYGVLYAALATLGCAFAIYGSELIGLGCILGALYLQGRIERERIWEGESAIERFFGMARRRTDNRGRPTKRDGRQE
jgi:hypothetical protein